MKKSCSWVWEHNENWENWIWEQNKNHKYQIFCGYIPLKSLKNQEEGFL